LHSGGGSSSGGGGGGRRRRELGDIVHDLWNRIAVYRVFLSLIRDAPLFGAVHHITSHHIIIPHQDRTNTERKG
jgi:hypothetical protein